MNVTVNGQPKGDVIKKHGRWVWFRNSGAQERLPKWFRLANVREHIAAVCLADRQTVIIE